MQQRLGADPCARRSGRPSWWACPGGGCWASGRATSMPSIVVPLTAVGVGVGPGRPDGHRATPRKRRPQPHRRRERNAEHPAPDRLSGRRRPVRVAAGGQRRVRHRSPCLVCDRDRAGPGDRGAGAAAASLSAEPRSSEPESLRKSLEPSSAGEADKGRAGPKGARRGLRGRGSGGSRPGRWDNRVTDLASGAVESVNRRRAGGRSVQWAEKSGSRVVDREAGRLRSAG